MPTDWKFSTKAVDSIRESTARVNIWHGSIRSGKTTASLIRFITWLKHAPSGHLMMIGKTERTLERNILAPLADMIGARNYVRARGEGAVYLFGRQVLITGANDEKAEGKIRGITLAGAYGDEITLWPANFYRQLLGRMSVPGARFFGTTNADGPYHWLKVEYLDEAQRLNMRQFHFALTDNVALDPEYVAAIKNEYKPGSLWHKRFILGQWVSAEGAVYDMFHEAEHTVPDVPGPPPDVIDLSVDYGTTNPTSVGAYGSWTSPPEDGPRAVRLAGWYHDGGQTGHAMTDREVAEQVTEWARTLPAPVRYVITDPSAASLQAELRQHGLKVRKARNDVLPGIRTQAKMLDSHEYLILRDPSNAPCIREYGAYVWDAKAQARGLDRPLKQHDHTKDEERYYLHTLFGRDRADLQATRRKAGLGA